MPLLTAVKAQLTVIMGFSRHGSATFRALLGLVRRATRACNGVVGYERGFAYRVDEGADRLRPFGRARPHQSPDGAPDAGLSDARPAYRSRPCPRPRRFQARR